MKRKITAIITMLAICTALSACSQPEKQPENSVTSVTTSSTSATELVEPEEHGTSAYVDYLFYKAKADAEIATDEELQAALDWLKDNVDNIFDSQENMELAMYNGELLERKYKDSGNAFEKIGWQAYKTVKYVYRGAESVDDQATEDNYSELKALLSSADNIA